MSFKLHFVVDLTRSPYSEIMAGSSIAGIVGAGAGVISAIALLVGALPALIKVLRQVRQVHSIVNQQRTDMQNYQRALERALRDHGVEIPIDQSIEPTH